MRRLPRRPRSPASRSTTVRAKRPRRGPGPWKQAISPRWRACTDRTPCPTARQRGHARRHGDQRGLRQAVRDVSGQGRVPQYPVSAQRPGPELVARVHPDPDAARRRRVQAPLRPVHRRGRVDRQGLAVCRGPSLGAGAPGSAGADLQRLRHRTICSEFMKAATVGSLRSSVRVAASSS